MPSSGEGMTDGQQFRSAPSTCIQESQFFAGRYRRKVIKKDQNGSLFAPKFTWLLHLPIFMSLILVSKVVVATIFVRSTT